MKENRNDNTLTDYSVAVSAIKTAILQGQYEAAKTINRIQLALYFGIGKYLSQHTRLNGLGRGALEKISEQLRRELPGLRGFSATQLREMRIFYEEWRALDINSSVATDELGEPKNNIQLQINQSLKIPEMKDFPIEDFFKVPFTHHSCILVGTKDLNARYYYIHRVAEEHLSVQALKKLIQKQAYTTEGKIPNNFQKTLPTDVMARKAVMMFKDEYLLDFINVEEIGEREQIDIDERVVEQQIILNIKNFIMSFGNDFAFIGNQYHLEIYGVEHFPDLLFFNRELNAMVVIELKTGEFKTSYLGQLMTYLSILDTKVKKPHENPSIGIILCKSANKEYVEFVIQDYNKPMGVATYKTIDEMPEPLRKALPNIEELKKLL